MTASEQTELCNRDHLPVTNGKIGEGVHFERIRRITGYLVGTVERFNDAKQAEVRDRVKHLRWKCDTTEEATRTISIERGSWHGNTIR